MLYNGRGGTTYSCLKLPFYADPDPCLIHSSFCPTCPQSKRHFDRLSRFSVVHGRETTESELSVGWVDHGLGRVEILKDFSGLCWGSENVLTLSSLCPNVCLLYTYGVRLGCGLGWVSGLVGSVGLKKVDPKTTLHGISVVMGRIYAMQQ